MFVYITLPIISKEWGFLEVNSSICPICSFNLCGTSTLHGDNACFKSRCVPYVHEEQLYSKFTMKTVRTRSKSDFISPFALVQDSLSFRCRGKMSRLLIEFPIVREGFDVVGGKRMLTIISTPFIHPVERCISRTWKYHVYELFFKSLCRFEQINNFGPSLFSSKMASSPFHLRTDALATNARILSLQSSWKLNQNDRFILTSEKRTEIGRKTGVPNMASKSYNSCTHMNCHLWLLDPRFSWMSFDCNCKAGTRLGRWREWTIPIVAKVCKTCVQTGTR